MSTLADEKPDANSWFDRHQRSAWIAAAASIVAALIAALVPVLTSSGDDQNTAGAPAVVPTPSASAPPPSASGPTSGSVPATTPVPSQTPPPGPSTTPAGTQLWQGSLLLDTEPKDLDAAPPEPVGYADSGDVYMLLNHQLEGWNGTLIAQWSGATGALPGYQECANAVGALGSRDAVKLSKRTVLCVRTSDRNIARLKVTSVGEGLDDKATFNAVIWNAG